MIKKQRIFRITGFAVLLFLCAGLAPGTISAQTREGESPFGGDWSHIRGRNSALQNKISKLDDDMVEDLPLPILFGLTPDNLTRNFGDPRSGGRTHEGLDIMAPRRALVVSPTEAVVLSTGTGDSAGNYVYTANPGGETFAYMHLDEIADISEGDVLETGDLIGYVGNTGNAAGGATHLHFEVREDKTATDPFPRLTRIFPVADKIDYLEKILDDAKDEKALAESVVALYRKDLVQAQALDIALPSSITEALANKVAQASSIARVLQLGSKGDDVAALQESLGIAADGSFGPKTKAAVIAFQKSKGLIADGVFGAKSRAALSATATTTTSKAGCTPTTIFSPTTGVKC
ncbi:MAG: peptidoglycan DD-metalloendopeptidase family protein [bacterium]